VGTQHRHVVEPDDLTTHTELRSKRGRGRKWRAGASAQRTSIGASSRVSRQKFFIAIVSCGHDSRWLASVKRKNPSRRARSNDDRRQRADVVGF
jgi:hypothetical protein